MIYWVVIKPDVIGIFYEFHCIIDQYEQLKEFMKPFKEFTKAYTCVEKALSWEELYALDLDKQHKMPVNQWIMRG